MSLVRIKITPVEWKPSLGHHLGRSTVLSSSPNIEYNIRTK